MEEIGKALKVVFDKISDFFDIFDLSFFVSGFFTTSIILAWIKLRELPLSINFYETRSIIIIVLFCYINGLLSFALGRWIRMGILAYPANFIRQRKQKPKGFDERFEKILKAHGMDSDPEIQKYLSRSEHRGIWRLYVLLWAKLRDNEKYAKSLAFLRRYWVMAATYDGLSISIFIATLLVIEAKIGIIGNAMIIDLRLFITIVSLLIFLFMACIREANRFVEYQIEEVVASIVSNKESQGII
ncbi:hypothetical protein [Fluviicola taffensis]|uniref:hypothetical protein n=1 Tax=Fluviicola taffensis TaxID=191579 RepID=UPI003137BD55